MNGSAWQTTVSSGAREVLYMKHCGKARVPGLHPRSLRFRSLKAIVQGKLTSLSQIKMLVSGIYMVVCHVPGSVLGTSCVLTHFSVTMTL